MTRFVVAFFVLCLALTIYGEELAGLCVSVADGDTLTVLDASGKRHRVRLFGIDSPERSQAYGGKARWLLNSMAYRRNLHVKIKDRDRYGRLVGDVYLGDKHLNLEMVRQGYAWHYVHYAPDSRELAEAQRQARSNKAGLWADEHPMEPWKYRWSKRRRR